MNMIPRTVVALHMNKRNAPSLLALAKAIYNAMTAAAADFPAPTPALPVFLTQIQELDAAQQATHTRAVGTAAVRNAKAAVVVTSMESLQTYVQTLCDASPEQAAALIAAAAMKVAAPRSHPKALLDARLGTTSGTTMLSAYRKVLVGKRAKCALFNWQYSVDGGKTWVGVPSTPLASTEIQGLPPMTTVSFRVSVTVSKVTSAWSQAIAILVR